MSLLHQNYHKFEFWVALVMIYAVLSNFDFVAKVTVKNLNKDFTNAVRGGGVTVLWKYFIKKTVFFERWLPLALRFPKIWIRLARYWWTQLWSRFWIEQIFWDKPRLEANSCPTLKLSIEAFLRPRSFPSARSPNWRRIMLNRWNPNLNASSTRWALTCQGFVYKCHRQSVILYPFLPVLGLWPNVGRSRHFGRFWFSFFWPWSKCFSLAKFQLSHCAKAQKHTFFFFYFLSLKS